MKRRFNSACQDVLGNILDVFVEAFQLIKKSPLHGQLTQQVVQNHPEIGAIFSQESRWLIRILIPAISGFLGAVLGAAVTLIVSYPTTAP